MGWWGRMEAETQLPLYLPCCESRHSRLFILRKGHLLNELAQRHCVC